MKKKVSNEDELLKFVNLVEEYKIILSKSQLRAINTQKREAIAEMRVKWANISGQTLTEQALLKKLHNMKSRMNAAADKTILTDWQNKLREIIIGSDTTKDVAQASSDAYSNDEASTSSGINLARNDVGRRKRTAEDVLDEWENDDTKLLNGEQLQRYTMLKYLKLVNLKIEQHEAESVEIEVVELPNEKEDL